MIFVVVLGSCCCCCVYVYHCMCVCFVCLFFVVVFSEKGELGMHAALTYLSVVLYTVNPSVYTYDNNATIPIVLYTVNPSVYTHMIIMLQYL